ncbi:MAG TPA: M56 family metallopeptidase [Thermoanaerobaculia bacterium]|nr:M56 family metallopeptidase [Thermoanaerobaculia bacterium]
MPDLARTVYYLGVHLLYASLVWLCAWLLTSSRIGSATTKYWIWVATALNFILPTGAILDRIWANHLSWATPLQVIGAAGVAVAAHSTVAAVLGAVWLVGASVMLVRLILRIRAERRDSRAGDAAPVAAWLAGGVPVKYAGRPQAPAVAGLLRPHISLPRGIERLLSGPELNAVLIHELTHARRRDNLVRVVYEVGLCVFWFHPLVWVSGSRLALYRELSCDESVIRSNQGGDLISALCKLANPQEDLLLQASAASFLSHRLASLVAARPRAGRAVNALLAVLFGAVVAGGVLETIAHTACCFLTKR